MGAVCGVETPIKDYVQEAKTKNQINLVMLTLIIVVCQASLFIIFVWRYDLRKPCFIIVLWTFIVVMILVAIAQAQIIFWYNHLNYSTH